LTGVAFRREKAFCGNVSFREGRRRSAKTKKERNK
jgi:hypothetical protein